MVAAASSPQGLLLLLRQGESTRIIQQQAAHRRRSMARASSASSPQREQVTKLVCVRHGETDLNRSHIIQGRMDTNLNQIGGRQAAMVARLLSEGAEPAAIYSSDMKRARQTAQAIATACGSRLVVAQDLTEMHMGEFQGQNKDDVKRSEAYETFRRGGRDQPIPGGGESFNQLSERCVSFLNAIAKKHQGELVVVVSHELVIREICRHADPMGSNGSEIPNASISVVHIFSSDGRWTVEKFGDVEHLVGDGSPIPIFGNA